MGHGFWPHLVEAEAFVHLSAYLHHHQPDIEDPDELFHLLIVIGGIHHRSVFPGQVAESFP